MEDQEEQGITLDEQESGTDMTPEDAKASLGLATRLNEQFLMSQVPQEAPVEAQGEDMMPETEDEEPEVSEKEEMSEEHKKMMAEEVKKQVEEQLAPMKEALQKALNQDEE